MPDEFDKINHKLSKALNRLASIREIAEDINRQYLFSNDPYECGASAASSTILDELDDQEEIEKKAQGK